MNIWLTIVLVIGLSSSLNIPDVDLDYDYELSSVKNHDGEVSDTENSNYYDEIEGSDEESQIPRPLPEPVEEIKPLTKQPKETDRVSQSKETRATSNQGMKFFYFFNFNSL